MRVGLDDLVRRQSVKSGEQVLAVYRYRLPVGMATTENKPTLTATDSCVL